MSSFTAISAEAFVDSIGVNTDIGNASTSYSNTALVESELTYLGVENARDTMAAPTDGALYQSVAKATGVKFDIFLSASAFSIDGQIAEMAANTNIIKYFEGVNEADTWPVTYKGLTGFAAIGATQQALWTMATTTRAAAGIGVIAPSYGLQSSFASSPNMSTLSTLGNTHEYWGTGNPPGGDIPGMIAKAQMVSSSPVVATEAGYYVGPSLQGNSIYAAGGVDQLVQAKYDLTLLFDDWVNGIQNTYLFDLMDLQADSRDQNFEDHYGLFNADGSAKLSAVALHNLVTVLGGTGTGAPSGGTLGYQLIGMPTTGHSLLMQGASGGYDLALWNDIRLWGATTNAEVSNAAAPITINFGQTVGTVSEYDPIAGTTAIATWSNVSSISLGLLDHPVILSITPAATTSSLSLGSFILPEAVAATQSSANLWSAILANAHDSKPGARLTISSIGTAGTSGSVTFNAATDTLIYQAPSYNPLNPTDSFTYTLADGLGGQITGTVAVTETPPANTTYGTTTNDALTAPVAGWTLDSFSTGETLTDCASGRDTLIAGAGGVVFANGSSDVITGGAGTHTLDVHGNAASITLGTGNNVIGLSGSGYTVKTGSGNNVVWKSLGSTSITMGDGNQAITVSGANNTIAIGTGTSTINAGTDGLAAGAETVTVGGGVNTINVGGAGDTVTALGGTNTVNASGGAASIVIDAGTTRIVAQNGGNTVNLTASSSYVTLSGNGNAVTGGSGTDFISSSGNNDIYVLGSGSDTISAYGSADQITLGNGNNVIGLSGSGYAIKTGNGNNVVWKSLGSTSITTGNGNQVITVGGTHNNISTGNGQSIINAGTDGNAAGFETVLVAAGTNTINVGGAKDSVTALSGTNTVGSSGGAASIVVGAGTSHIVAQNGGNTVNLMGSSSYVTLSGNANTVTAGSGSDFISSTGNNDVYVLGSGSDTISAYGSADQITLGNGNNVIGLSGSGYTIKTGNGNNVVWKSLGSTSITMGDGNQSITVSGSNNTVSIGTGASTINAGTDGLAAGAETVTVGGGVNTINVGGAGDTVTALGGTNSIVASGTAATIVAEAGANVITAGQGGATVTLVTGTNSVVVAGNSNSVIGGSGSDKIWAGGNANTIIAGSGTEAITTAGQGDVVDLTSGLDTYVEQGNGNTIVLSASSVAAAQISGNVIAHGDVFDLRGALSGTSWNGSLTTLSSYLHVANAGSQSTISISNNGSGAGTTIAVLQNVAGLTYQAFLQDAILSQSLSVTDVAGSNLSAHSLATITGSVPASALVGFGVSSQASTSVGAASVVIASAANTATGSLIVHPGGG